MIHGNIPVYSSLISSSSKSPLPCKEHIHRFQGFEYRHLWGGGALFTILYYFTQPHSLFSSKHPLGVYVLMHLLYRMPCSPHSWCLLQDQHMFCNLALSFRACCIQLSVHSLFFSTLLLLVNAVFSFSEDPSFHPKYVLVLFEAVLYSSVFWRLFWLQLLKTGSDLMHPLKNEWFLLHLPSAQLVLMI